MDIDIRLDLVPENVEALARFADLFAKPRFHRIACPGIDPQRDSDLRTLRRTMEAVLEAAARRGMVHQPTPREDARDNVQEELAAGLAALVEHIEAAVHQAGAGGGAVIMAEIQYVLDHIRDEKAAPVVKLAK